MSRPTFKEARKAMFDSLRAEGVFARQSWQCCQSCGWAAVPDDHKGGVAFYHNQDAEDINAMRGFHVTFGSTVDGATDADAVAVGERVALAAMRAGLVVTWDGTAENRVHVAMPEVKL